MDNFDADLYDLLFSNSLNSQNTATSPMNTTAPNTSVSNAGNNPNTNTAPMSNTVQNSNNLNAVNNMTAPAVNNAMPNTNVSNVAENNSVDSKIKYVADKASQLRQPKTAFPAETPVGMAYVPYQMWEKIYDSNIGFARGTVFPSLDKPFIGEEAVPYERKR